MPARDPSNAPRGSDAAPGGTDRPDERREEHEGATEEQVGDRMGPGAGYDREPEQVKDPRGVA